MLKRQNLCYEDLILVRCVITGESNEYFKGKDYQGNNYLIKKNKSCRGFSIGNDTTFHAYKEKKSLLLKKTILNPLSTNEYIELLGDRGSAGKTLKEIGIKIDKI